MNQQKNPNNQQIEDLTVNEVQAGDVIGGTLDGDLTGDGRESGVKLGYDWAKQVKI